MSEELERRCPTCDALPPAGATDCPLCGAALPAEPAAPPKQPSDKPAEAGVAEDMAAGPPPVIESVMREKQAPVTLWLTAFFTLIILIVGIALIRNPLQLSVALYPTATPIPPTPTYTPTYTPPPTETLPPTETPTITPTPLPTDTPRPPRFHSVVANETLFGLSLRYGVTAGSIAEANELGPESAIQVGQNLVIPWPTATPPLEAIALEIGGETVIADPANCEWYEIQGGDNLFAIAAGRRIPLEALQRVNRLTDQSIIRPGDALCIPDIIRGGVLPPTPGPSPTATPTLPPAGPHLLYPVRGAVIDPPEGPLLLQWTAVKPLAENEWYMVEVTNLSMVDSHPFRGFTRDTAFRLPAAWRPPVEELHEFRWRVSIVQVTGQRSDGSFIYTFGGEASEEAAFSWVGAAPTPTPTPTAAPTEAE